MHTDHHDDDFGLHLEKRVPYDGRELLVVVSRPTHLSRTYVMVPGFLESYRSGKRYGRVVSMVDPVRGEQQTGVEKAVREAISGDGLAGVVRFLENPKKEKVA